jgi:hypothetical protein
MPVRDAAPAWSFGARLRQAQGHAAERGAGIDRLYLNPVARGIPGVDVHERIVAARARMTIEGASTLEVSVHDPDWLIEASQLLDIGHTGRMHAVDVRLDTLDFRLVKASRQDPSTLELTFEDRVVALLRQHTKPKTWRRGLFTRAEAIKAMVDEVKLLKIPFYSPESSRRQPIATPDYPDAKPPHGDTGFDDGVKLKIKGQTADAQQMREMATALTVADQMNAGPRARLAMLVAGIGESSFTAIPNAAGSGYAGVFQAHPKNIPMKDTEQQARYFLKGGKGFQAGGAIKLARDEPNISPGAIATRVEASGENPSFYDKYRKEADAILAAWNKGDGADTDTVTYAKQYRFMRGYPDGPKGENSWDAMTRLAEQVQWRLYTAASVVIFVSDDLLITTPASLVLHDPLGEGLIDRPTYDWDHGKRVAEMGLQVHARRWELVPGSIVALLGDKWGPVKGRWIVKEVDQNLLDPTDCQVTLTKPVPALKEPAPDITTRDEDASSTRKVKSKIPDETVERDGAAGIVDRCAAIAKSFGTYVSSAYRPGSITTSGNVSDHSQNNAHMAARDIAVKGIDAITGPPSPKLDDAVVRIGWAFGRNYTLGETIDADTFQWQGYRIQIIWRTPKYGGHMGHIHVGARKA